MRRTNITTKNGGRFIVCLKTLRRQIDKYDVSQEYALDEAFEEVMGQSEEEEEEE